MRGRDSQKRWLPNRPRLAITLRAQHKKSLRRRARSIQIFNRHLHLERAPYQPAPIDSIISLYSLSAACMATQTGVRRRLLLLLPLNVLRIYSNPTLYFIVVRCCRFEFHFLCGNASCEAVCDHHLAALHASSRARHFNWSFVRFGSLSGMLSVCRAVVCCWSWRRTRAIMVGTTKNKNI